MSGPIRSKIEDALAHHIRPLIQADGGDVFFGEVNTSVNPIEIILLVDGRYRGCPGTPIVAKYIIEPFFERFLGQPVRLRMLPRPFGSLASHVPRPGTP
ncbi:MAG: NifU family protein [Sandaracinaceae bacterium]|nr:NifU family protein [Sandaracinaceae bacterium]MDW8245265.1 NifU family protein [Sandaracinaceae bacterium]